MVDNSSKKNRGVVYTPESLVESILDLSGYQGESIRAKHVMENSCGEGAFLCEIVDRYCALCSSLQVSSHTVKKELETYIHGLEIDPDAVGRCVANLNNVTERYGVIGVEWDVKAEDATTISRFDGQMDFVVGNPPYVRIHNIGGASSLKKVFSFFQEGMSDLYIAFFEIGLRMLKDKGTLGYITPSSYFNSLAGSRMREYFVRERCLKKIVDMKHFQAFDDAMTYTAITVLQKGRSKDLVYYYEYDGTKQKPFYVSRLQAHDYCLNGKFFFASQSDLFFLRNIFSCIGESAIYVKNGFATLCDSVFVSSSFPFHSKHIIPVVKASRGLEQQIIFPYDESCKPLSEEILKLDEKLYDYLLKRRDQLLARSFERSGKEYWFAYGRSQGISDVYKEKLSLNTLIRNSSDLKALIVPSGAGVYGGLYVTSRSTPLTSIRSQLFSDEFISYASLLGKYKSGGYFTFSSKDVKKYLDYKFAYQRGLF